MKIVENKSRSIVSCTSNCTCSKDPNGEKVEMKYGIDLAKEENNLHMLAVPARSHSGYYYKQENRKLEDYQNHDACVISIMPRDEFTRMSTELRHFVRCVDSKYDSTAL